jgi:hypothetical protein
MNGSATQNANRNLAELQHRIVSDATSEAFKFHVLRSTDHALRIALTPQRFNRLRRSAALASISIVLQNAKRA